MAFFKALFPAKRRVRRPGTTLDPRVLSARMRADVGLSRDNPRAEATRHMSRTLFPW